MAHFIPCNKTTDAPELAALFRHNIVRLHGFPDNIVSDRGPQFTSNFWTNLMNIMGVKLNHSTAFHPQSNGQSERVNQAVEQYLRSFCDYQQSNWANLLDTAEISHNNAQSSSTKLSPYFVNSGYHPRFDAVSLPSNSPAADILAETWKIAGENMSAAQEIYKSYADEHRAEQPTFEIGDMVWLSRRNISTVRTIEKLDYRNIGPFKIISVIGKSAYRLDLPASMKIHNVFHVSLLSPYHANTIPGRTPVQPLPITINDHEELEVEAVLDSRRRRGCIEYLVHWMGQWIEVVGR